MIGPDATIGEAIDTIARCWRALSMEAQGPATDYERDRIDTGAPGTVAPKDFGSAAERIKARLLAVARLSEIELQSTLAGRPYSAGDNYHPSKKAVRALILQEEGHPPAELAFLFRITEDHVKRIRREAGRDPEDGTRLGSESKPLTEPVRDTLRRRRAEA